MITSLLCRLQRIGLALLACFGFVNAPAQTVAVPALRLIVPVQAGGNMDEATRFMGQRLSQRLGRPVIIENRPGAQQAIGTDYVVHSAPDGNTLLVVGAAVTSNPHLYKLNYQALTDLTPVAGLIRTRFALVVRKDLPVQSVDELIALLRAGSMPLSCGAAPGPSLLGCEQLRLMTRPDLVVAPYNGAAPVSTALLGGHVDMAFISTDVILGQAGGGRWQVLAITDREPLAAPLPRLPVLQERLPGFSMVAFFGILAPAKTPPEQIAQLSQAIAEVQAMPDVEEHFTRQGDTLLRLGPREFGLMLSTETERVGDLIRRAGIKAQ